MSFISNHSKLVAIGASCAVAGIGAGVIANAGATKSSSTTTTTSSTAHRAGALGPRRLAARAVQGQVVVDTRNGFVTVTFDRGYVQSVSGQQLTLREATKKSTYKTVTLTIPAGARVRDNGKAAALSALQPGQRVAVVQAPNRTIVVARTPKTS